MTPGPEAVWHAALAEGRFLLQRATGSGTVIFPPRVAEPATGDEELEWVEAAGLGRIYSLTVVHPRPPAPPYAVALIDLDEGARVLSRVDGDPAALAIGQRVRGRVEASGGEPLFLFGAV